MFRYMIAGVLVAIQIGCQGNNDDGKSGGENTGGEAVDAGAEGFTIEAFEGTNSGLTFDPPRGIYEEPVEVTITHETAEEVRMTLDGSDPRTSETALVHALPAVIPIDPTDTTDRYTAPGVVVRATVAGEDGPPDAVVTHTYLFVDQVVPLSPVGEAPGPQWPEPPRSGGHNMDYGMDPDVVDDPVYREDVTTALLDIPSFSLVTDLANLFDEEIGIYMNPEERGDEWERICSIELLRPDDIPGFQSNAGVRIRGGYSRQTSNPKHSFRFYFRTEWGTAKLIYPLFEEEGAAAFDKVDLRTSQNYSWNAGASESYENTLNRDVFSRDLQGALGHPYTRSRYYHLYINGVYWGLYQTQERSEARYAATYLGGDNDEYDVIKVDAAGGNIIEATDGNLDLWELLWEMTEDGFASDENYFRLEGKDINGDRDMSQRVMVDLDNLIDYMLIIFFTGNIDGPVTKFGSNNVPINFYAIISRTNPDQGFVFFAHDNEHTLFAEPISINAGLDENRVSIGDEGGATSAPGVVNDSYVMRIEDSAHFNPQWLHHRLTENDRYRERFSRRARELLGESGQFMPDYTVPMFDSRTDEIRFAIIAESARWGDSHPLLADEPRTPADDWIPAIRRIRNRFLPERPDIVIDQLDAAGLY